LQWAASKERWRWWPVQAAGSAGPAPRAWRARAQELFAPTSMPPRPKRPLRASALPAAGRSRSRSMCGTARRSMLRWPAVVREYGRLDVLLDSAGVSGGASFLDFEHSEWERIIAVNLTGMFHLGQAAARQMVRQGGEGSIINVTSQLAEVARPGSAAYIASKGGGRSLTQAMALDLAPHGIRVNAIAPGPTLTGLTRATYADPERRRATITQIPLGRMGDPQDLVGAILFLASDESRWVTGSTVTVDGGYVAQ